MEWIPVLWSAVIKFIIKNPLLALCITMPHMHIFCSKLLFFHLHVYWLLVYSSCWRVLEPSVAWLILVSEPDPHCKEKRVWEIGWSGIVPGAQSADTPLIPLSKRNSYILMCKISAITSATLLSMVCDYADMHTHAQLACYSFYAMHFHPGLFPRPSFHDMRALWKGRWRFWLHYIPSWSLSCTDSNA